MPKERVTDGAVDGEATGIRSSAASAATRGVIARSFSGVFNGIGGVAAFSQGAASAPSSQRLATGLSAVSAGSSSAAAT